MRLLRWAGRSLLWAASAVWCVACAAQPAPVRLPELELGTAGGGTLSPARAARGARATLLFFFSADCPCQALHDARIRALYAEYHAQGVAFFAVDSEGHDRTQADAEARARGYAFPVLVDPGARLATSVGAEYATYTLVLDSGGTIRYRGGFDSDRIALRDGRAQWARDALSDVLAGKAPRVPETKALGCALRRF